MIGNYKKNTWIVLMILVLCTLLAIGFLYMIIREEMNQSQDTGPKEMDWTPVEPPMPDMKCWVANYGWGDQAVVCR